MKNNIRIVIYKIAEAWYTASGSHNGRMIVGFGRSHSEAVADFFDEATAWSI